MKIEVAFHLHYEAIRAACLSTEAIGLAIFAIHRNSNRIAAQLMMAAQMDRPITAVIGRHGYADVFLPEDPSISLRHLMVILEPPVSVVRPEVRFRVLDCRTGVAFADERGRRLESVVAEGPIFIECGDYTVMFLVTGDATNFPPSAADAFAFIPERVYLEEAERPKYEQHHLARGMGPPGKTTFIAKLGGALSADAPALGFRLGEIVLWNQRHQMSVPVTEEAANRGILLGSYERCNGYSSPVMACEGISRVHVLVLRIGDAIYAVDTGSTNGTYLAPLADDDHTQVGLPGQRVRSARLGPETHIILGYRYASLRWLPGRVA